MSLPEKKDNYPEMTEAAKKAFENLKAIMAPEQIMIVASWWKENLPKCGHKRLGRELVAFLNGDLSGDVAENMVE